MPWDWVCPPKAELAERQDPVARDIGDGRCAGALPGQANQAELDGFAAAKVSSAMRLAVIAATRAGAAVLAVAKAPSYCTMSASASASGELHDERQPHHVVLGVGCWVGRTV
jgi:hypothetical protein